MDPVDAAFMVLASILVALGEVEDRYREDRDAIVRHLDEWQKIDTTLWGIVEDLRSIQR